MLCHNVLYNSKPKPRTSGFLGTAFIYPVATFKDSLLMLFGRLEIFGLLQLFMMKWWK